jgi:hypothetical protein
VIAARGLQKLSRIVTDAGLTELIGQKGLAIACGMNERSGAVVVRFRLHGILLFEKQTDDADINLEFLFVGAVSTSSVRSQEARVIEMG